MLWPGLYNTSVIELKKDEVNTFTFLKWIRLKIQFTRNNLAFNANLIVQYKSYYYYFFFLFF